jgi:cytochrome c peroxidase
VVAYFDLQLRAAAIVQNSPVADADYLAASWAIFGTVWQVDPADGLFLRFLTLDYNAISEGNQLGLGFFFRGCGHRHNSVNG